MKKIGFSFKVTQLASNAGILYDLQRFFGAGSVVIDNRKDNTLKYHVQNQADLTNVIIPHFLAYPLVTSKGLNFNDFKQALELKRGVVLPSEGLSVTAAIFQLKEGMNKGRSFEDKFNSVFVKVLNPQWVLAFADGEGLFYVYTAMKNSRGSSYQGVDPSFEVGQSSHDYAVLLSLKAFFDGGYVSPSISDASVLADVRGLRDKSIFKLRDTGKITLFFDSHSLLTDKLLDYNSFKAILSIKASGEYKTPEGMAKIAAIRGNMNRARRSSST